ncbi:hypothetical protein [Nocardia sp. NPDC024068]|uniref:hypothetical protein n=1 Tax=Nocardia sp. NPDC024068 TaxID=3157197 RepID=UPI00340FD579
MPARPGARVSRSRGDGLSACQLAGDRGDGVQARGDEWAFAAAAAGGGYLLYQSRVTGTEDAPDGPDQASPVPPPSPPDRVLAVAGGLAFARQ